MAAPNRPLEGNLFNPAGARKTATSPRSPISRTPAEDLYLFYQRRPRCVHAKYILPHPFPQLLFAVPSII